MQPFAAAVVSHVFEILKERFHVGKSVHSQQSHRMTKKCHGHCSCWCKSKQNNKKGTALPIVQSWLMSFMASHHQSLPDSSTLVSDVFAPRKFMCFQLKKRINVGPWGCQFSLHFISSGNGRNFLYCRWIGWDMHIPKYTINESLQTKCDVAMWLIFSGILMGLAMDFF